MVELSESEHQIRFVNNFQELISTQFYGNTNAICWSRQLTGNFSEIVDKLELSENMAIITKVELCELQLSEEGNLAREILLNDIQLLEIQGASPLLNLIKSYNRDVAYPFFPIDVYSFHVDQSPVPTNTFLCTYYGEPSEILPNALAEQKVLIPEIRDELKKLYIGDDESFKSFLSEHFFDLHYQAKPDAIPINLGVGHLWKLAVDYPQSNALPCIHRAPNENGQKRLLLIC